MAKLSSVKSSIGEVKSRFVMAKLGSVKSGIGEVLSISVLV
jgi:hypothetical protein